MRSVSPVPSRVKSAPHCRRCQSNSNFADLVRPAQLRGLSPDQTLVLINGKRRHGTATLTTESKLGKGTSPVDLNNIPVSAIKGAA